jgi:hypothetical protein
MFAIVSAFLRYLLSRLRPKHELALENLALRHQIAVLNRPAHKPRLQGTDRLFWVVLRGWLSLPENPSMARSGIIQSCQLT